MDFSVDALNPDPLGTTIPLSYDDSVPYEDQRSTHPSNDPERTGLASRIGSTKVYLLSESSTSRVAKVRWW